MTIDTRKLASVYHITAEEIDDKTFLLVLCGSTARGRELRIEATVQFGYVPYLMRSLVKHWLEAKKRRLAQINEVDAVLPGDQQ